VARHTLVPGETVRIRDERWEVTRATPGVDASVLEVRGRDRSNLDARTSFLLPFEVVERLGSEHSARRVRRGRWRRLTRGLLAEATPSWSSLRTPLRARISLWSFQLEPALALTHGIASRILIADEVGLGKTIQAALIIAEVLERTSHGRVLVVAPASLKEQWQVELHDRFDVDAWLADSTSIARLGAAWGTANPWAGRPVTITSIDFVKRAEVMRALEALVWDAVVFDEAHGLTGRSDRAAAAGALARRARNVVLLTATPHSGDDQAFASLCGLGDLHPELAPQPPTRASSKVDHRFPLLTFRRTRDDVGMAVSRRTKSLRVRPTLAEREMHRALSAYASKVRRQHSAGSDPAHLAMMVLTRRACSSASSFARSVERRLDLLSRDGASALPQMMLPLFEESADEAPDDALSAPGLDDHAEECRWLERLLLLARRAQTDESKFRTLTRFLTRAREPAIVFTEYRDTLTRLAEALRNFSPVTLHGGLATPERRQNLRAFTSGAARLLLATDAASEGLNLQHRCRLVINLELPWTPLRLEQRIGRVERIGQSRRVHAVHLLAGSTAEESYVSRLLARTDRATSALERLRSDPPPVQHLRATAQTEMARLETLRALSSTSASRLPQRPPVTLLRKPKSGRGNLWGFHLSFIDSADRLVWHTILGAITATHPDATALGRAIDEAATLLASRLENEGKTALASLNTSLRPYLSLASRREQAIADILESERARLSAPLLQRGLFDRRAERAVVAQRAVVDEALGRCRTRLDELAAAAQIAAEPGRLAFALIRR
jgi:superfamily II DNA or RNA helicase